MSRRKMISDPVRSRIVDFIEEELERARGSIQLAQDIADLLNANDTTGDKIEIDSNVIMGVFKPKEAQK